MGRLELEKIDTNVLNKFALFLAARGRVEGTDDNLFYCSRKSWFYKAPADFKVRRNIDWESGEGEQMFRITKSYSSSASSSFRPWIRDINNAMKFKSFLNFVFMIKFFFILPNFGMYPNMDLILSELVDEAAELGED